MTLPVPILRDQPHRQRNREKSKSQRIYEIHQELRSISSALEFAEGHEIWLKGFAIALERMANELEEIELEEEG